MLRWIAVQGLGLIYKRICVRPDDDQPHRCMVHRPYFDVWEPHSLARSIDAWVTSSSRTSTPAARPLDRPRRSTSKRSKRAGGCQNFANYRIRLLPDCGVDWQTEQAARIGAGLTTVGCVEQPMLCFVNQRAESWSCDSVDFRVRGERMERKGV